VTRDKNKKITLYTLSTFDVAGDGKRSDHQNNHFSARRFVTGDWWDENPRVNYMGTATYFFFFFKILQVNEKNYLSMKNERNFFS